MEQLTPSFLIGICQRLDGAIWVAMKAMEEAPGFGCLFETPAMVSVAIQRNGA